MQSVAEKCGENDEHKVVAMDADYSVGNIYKIKQSKV